MKVVAIVLFLIAAAVVGRNVPMLRGAAPPALNPSWLDAGTPPASTV